MPNLVELVKQAAVEAVEAEKPPLWTFGTVVSENPLAIQIDQKLTLKRANLILSRQVTEHDVSMTVAHTTESALDGLDLTHTHSYSGTTETSSSHSHSYRGSVDGGGGKDVSHRHDYIGKKVFRVHNGLKIGEKVLLCRVQGGGKYLVIDRLEEG